MTWRCAPAYDSGMAGDYVFMAEVDGYPLAEGASLPEITVTLTEEAVKQQKTIVGWTFLDAEYLEGGVLALNGVNADNQADLETVVSMLPTAVMAEVSSGAAGAGATGGPETEKIEVGITGWSCTGYTQDEQGNWPVSGEYTFVAEPEPGYVWGTQPSVRVLLGGASVYVINDRFTVDGLRYKELGPDTVQLIGYEGAKPTGTLTIPSSVNKPSNGRAYTVASIGAGAFERCTGLTGDLFIPDTVTAIGSGAFSGCSGFTGSLTLSNALTIIEDGTFMGCGGFTGSLNLPASITAIGNVAFRNCSGFTGSLSIPDSVTEIGQYAFWNCSGFTGSLTLPGQLTGIGREAFSGCNGFTGRLILPDQLNIISIAAFMGCSGFTGGLVLPAQLAEIKDAAFMGCSGFTGVLRLPASLAAIGGSAFSGCNFNGYDAADQAVAELVDISGVPRYMITVNGAPYTYNDRTFISGSLRYEITGPDTVTLVGYDWSQGDPTGALNIPGTVMEQGVPYTVTAVGAWAFSGYTEFTGRLTLPDTLTKIGAYAFSDCSGFTGELALPDSLTEIGEGAFSDCSGFTGGLILPDALSRIEDFTFSGCSGFTGGLALPSVLAEIGDQAFYDCSSFTGELNIPDKVTMIGDYAFDGCDRLTSAHIGRGLQKIGTASFPAALPLSTDSPRVQLLINEYLDRDTIADTAWDGTEDAPGGAIATVKRDAAVAGDKRIGTEAQITVPEGVTLTVDGALTLDGDMHLSGQFIINGSLSGSGTLYVYRGGRVTGDVSKIRVVYCWTEETHNESRSSSRRASVWSGPLSYYLVPGDSISLRIPRADLQGLADAGQRLTLQCDTAKMSFAPAALRAILAAVPSTAGSVTFGARPADLSAYPAAAALIGGRPAYEFTLGYPGGNGEDVPVTAAFPAGAASVMLAYTPSAWEAGGSLSMVSVDGAGNASWLDKSGYGAEFASGREGAALQQSGGVLAEVPHFSIYGVAYRPSGQVFTDTAGHWAGDDILFAAVRGLLPGTGEGVFSPNAALTRGALAAALGRLAGVDVASYQASGSFRDVPADAYYAPYVEWAVQNHIMGGTGEKQFSPDAAVTREQLAAMMGNYAAQQGYVLQTPFAAEAYADGDQISTEALPWVIFMQRAGVLYSREGTRFAPQEAVTRGEGAAALRRLIEVGIDPDAARERRNNVGY